jgi:hypothetical protein
MARCRFRDSDGVTRIVERRGPADEHDKHGKRAEDALIEALQSRRAAGGPDITLDNKIVMLVDQHIDRLAEDGRAIRTIDTYRLLREAVGEDHCGRSGGRGDAGENRRGHPLDAPGSRRRDGRAIQDASQRWLTPGGDGQRHRLEPGA